MVMKFLTGGSDSQQESYSKPAYSFTNLAQLYKQAAGDLGKPKTELDLPEYKEPEPWKWITGDWDKFEDVISAVGRARLGEDADTARNRELARLRSIGMADDPATGKLLEETVERPYARGLSDILSSASATRFGLEQGALDQYNVGMTERNKLKNLYGLEAGTKEYALPWQNFLAQLQTYYQPSSVMKSRGTATASSRGGLSQLVSPIKIPGLS